MAHRAPWTLIVLLLAAPLAGCLGGDDGGGEELKETAEITAELGGIQGVVTDNAVQPVSGANVTLVETDETVRTAADGSFAFSRVRPGSYTVAVHAPGFVSARQDVDVRAGQVSALDFIVSHLDSKEAYTQSFELVGFFECGFEIGWNISALPEPADYFFLGLAACAFPNSVLGGNATNDRFAHFFELEAPIDTLIYEMHWEPSSQTSEWMTTQLEVQGFSNANPGRFWREQGPSPITTRLDKDVFVELDQDFKDACEGANDTEADDAYCGYGFWDAGWPLQTRVFPAWQCASEQGGGCAAIQQEFTHYIAAFYNAPAPEGYTIIDGSA